jgi:hypothetical protein
MEKTTLTASEKWLFVGHVLSTLGLMCLSIGSTIRLASEGKLPVQGNLDTKEPSRARDYFS